MIGLLDEELYGVANRFWELGYQAALHGDVRSSLGRLERVSGAVRTSYDDKTAEARQILAHLRTKLAEAVSPHAYEICAAFIILDLSLRDIAAQGPVKDRAKLSRLLQDSLKALVDTNWLYQR